MVKPVSLLYLYTREEGQPRLAHWPEVGRIDLAESHDTYVQNFCMGGPFETAFQVVSIASGDDDALRYVTECIKGVHVIAVRGQINDDDWASRLGATCDLRAMMVCEFDRHSVMSALGRKAFWDGIELLQLSAEHLRGPGVLASPDAMQTENTLSRAIEALCKTGYKTPRR